MQCLKVYARAGDGGTPSLLHLTEGLSNAVHTAFDMREMTVREEVREEVRSELREEVREEVRAEIWEEVIEEVREKVMVEMGEGVAGHKPLNIDEQNFLQLFTSAQQGLPESFQGGGIIPPGEQGRFGGLYPLNAGYPEKLQLSANSLGLSADSEDGPPLVKDDIRDDESLPLQPRQEASVPPYPQMASGPMMVPPGARPMVVPMPGMPPMGWYPYLPFHMFVPPNVNVLPPGPVPMAPDRADSPDDHLPESLMTEGITEETGSTTEEMPRTGGVANTVDDYADINQIPQVASAKPSPASFPSADLQSDTDIEVVCRRLSDANTQPSSILSTSPHDVELVTPQVNQFAAQGLDDISPSSLSPDPPSGTPPIQGKGDTQETPANPRPGLPCRRRDASDIDRELEEAEKVVSSSPPPSSSQRQPLGKGKGRQGHRNRTRDGKHWPSNHEKRHGLPSQPPATPPLDQPRESSIKHSATTENHTHLAPPTSDPSQSDKPRTLTTGSAEGVKKNAVDTKLNSEGVDDSSSKVSGGMKGGREDGGRGGRGDGWREKGGKGGRGGGRGEKGGKGGKGRGGGKDRPSKSTVGDEEKVGKDESNEAADGRHDKGGGHSQKFGEDRDGKRVSGGGTGGYRSHRTPQQNHSQAPSTWSQNDMTAQQQKRTRETAERPWKGQSRARVKRVNPISDSDSTQQEPTRSSMTSLKTSPDREPLGKLLPSFKNLYSSTSPEENDEYFSRTQESWPSMTQPQCDHIPSGPLPPPLRPPTGVCDHTPLHPFHPNFHDLHYDHSTPDSQCYNSELLTHFPALLSNRADTKPHNT